MAPTVVDMSRRCVEDESWSTATSAEPTVVWVVTAYFVPPGTVSFTSPTSLFTLTELGGVANVRSDSLRHQLGRPNSAVSVRAGRSRHRPNRDC